MFSAHSDLCKEVEVCLCRTWCCTPSCDRLENGLGCPFSCCVFRLRPIICVLSCSHCWNPRFHSRPSRGNPDCWIIWGTSRESSLRRGHRHSGQKVSPLKGGADTSFLVSQWKTISFFHFPFQWVLICREINNNTQNKTNLIGANICLYCWESNSVVSPGWLFINGVINYYIRMCRWWSIMQWWVNGFPPSQRVSCWALLPFPSELHDRPVHEVEGFAGLAGGFLDVGIQAHELKSFPE